MRLAEQIRGSLAAAAAMCRGLLARLRHRAPADPVVAPVVLPVPVPVAKPKPVVDAGEVYGRFHFRGDILDQLPLYFKYLRRMRRIDPDAYALYSQIGAHIHPVDATWHREESSAWFRAGHRPSFGCVSFCAPDNEHADGKWIGIKFAYFQKFRRWKQGVAPQPTRTGEQIYEVTGYFDEASDKKLGASGVPVQFYVGVSPDGSIRPLKQREWRKIGPAVEHLWRYPTMLQHWARDNQRPIENITIGLFLAVAYGIESAETGLRVFARKGGLTASFTIGMERTAYFFRDRDLEINDKGTRKKIFHIVRTHKRIVAGGHETYVKSHFRGERRFTWNGARVVITVPGKHHNLLAEAEMEAIMSRGKSTPKDTLAPQDFGAAVARHLHQ